MNYSAEQYQKSEWAIYCKKSSCFVLFGSRKEMKIRVKELNRQKQ